MPAASLPIDPFLAGQVAAGLLARMAGAVAIGGLPIFPGLSLQIRVAVAAALSLVALPAALAAASPDGAAAVPFPLAVVGESVVGMALGTAVALVIGASAWAGGILGCVSGLSWADDFDPTSEGETAGIGRLARWIGLGAFLAGGGQTCVVAGLVDSVRSIPVGTALSTDAAFATLVTTMPSVALSLAVTLAVPALAAVLAFHLATAVCLRTIPFTPGPGLLQALASLVLLAAVYLGAEAWSDGFGRMVTGPVESCFDGR